jgi:hypothetical protein
MGGNNDKVPPPAAIRKSNEQSIAKSVRASLTINQNPWFARNSSGIFVVLMAVVITIINGTAEALVQSPSNIRKPHKISKVPTKCAVKYGCGKPILVKRITPILGSMYLRIPCVKKISPTARRMNRMLAGPLDEPKKNWKSDFIVIF